VYAIFDGWRAFSGASLVTADVVVVPHDSWASGGAVHGARRSERQRRRTARCHRRAVHGTARQ
jgi:hypothetical protein